MDTACRMKAPSREQLLCKAIFGMRSYPPMQLPSYPRRRLGVALQVTSLRWTRGSVP